MNAARFGERPLKLEFGSLELPGQDLSDPDVRLRKGGAGRCRARASSGLAWVVGSIQALHFLGDSIEIVSRRRERQPHHGERHPEPPLPVVGDRRRAA